MRSLSSKVLANRAKFPKTNTVFQQALEVEMGDAVSQETLLSNRLELDFAIIIPFAKLEREMASDAYKKLPSTDGATEESPKEFRRTPNGAMFGMSLLLAIVLPPSVELVNPLIEDDIVPHSTGRAPQKKNF